MTIYYTSNIGQFNDAPWEEMKIGSAVRRKLEAVVPGEQPWLVSDGWATLFAATSDSLIIMKKKEGIRRFPVAEITDLTSESHFLRPKYMLFTCQGEPVKVRHADPDLLFWAVVSRFPETAPGLVRPAEASIARTTTIKIGCLVSADLPRGSILGTAQYSATSYHGIVVRPFSKESYYQELYCPSCRNRLLIFTKAGIIRDRIGRMEYWRPVFGDTQTIWVANSHVSFARHTLYDNNGEMIKDYYGNGGIRVCSAPARSDAA